MTPIPMTDRDFLFSRGWVLTGRVDVRKNGQGLKTVTTWWRRKQYRMPQFLALSFERNGWIGILDRDEAA
jgi:hypothetical protein